MASTENIIARLKSGGAIKRKEAADRLESLFAKVNELEILKYELTVENIEQDKRITELEIAYMNQNFWRNNGN